MVNVDIWNYGSGYKSTNPNTNAVRIGDLTLYFSYQTVVAFSTTETGLRCSENIWSVTTGKHLNMIADKKDRIPNEEFQKRLENILRHRGLEIATH